MTTERSGMSLDTSDMMTLAEIRERLWASRGLGGIELGNDEFECILDSLDANLSRDAVVTANDDIKKWLADPETVLVWMLRGIIAVPSHKAMADRFWDAEFSDESFAARHAAVPDEIDHFDAPEDELSTYSDRAYAQGWNACRKAMLAQRDGGTK